MAEIKNIEYPAAIDLNGDDYTFENFIMWTISTNTRYNTDAESIRAACRLERQIETHKDFSIDLEDWKRLNDAVENPQGGYPIRPGSRIMPFVDAVVDASSVV